MLHRIQPRFLRFSLTSVQVAPLLVHPSEEVRKNANEVILLGENMSKKVQKATTKL